MRRKAAAIVQQKGGWYGVTFTIRQKEIAGLRLTTGRSLQDLKGSVGEDGYGVGFDNGSAYLLSLAFPFTDRRKIRLVIANEVEERLPVTTEDMVVDFVESGRGRVLAGAMPRSLVGESFSDKRVRIVTIQSLAALYALRWFDVIVDRDFVFLHMNGSAVVVMAFKDDSLLYLRQFVHSPQSSSLHDAFAQIAEDRQFAPASYVMVADDVEGARVREYLEKTFRIAIEVPSLSRVLGREDAPDWLWAGVGTALLSAKPAGHLDLSGQKRQYAFLPFLTARGGLYVSAGLALFSFLVCGLACADYYFKERTYQFLASEPSRIYRLSFPKSPPVRDPVRMFQEKIKALDREPGVAGAASNPLDVLNEVSGSIGADIDVKVSEFSADDKEFSFSGTTISFASAEKIKTSVEQIKGVTDVEMQNLELAANKQVKFKLRGKL